MGAEHLLQEGVYRSECNHSLYPSQRRVACRSTWDYFMRNNQAVIFPGSKKPCSFSNEPNPTVIIFTLHPTFTFPQSSGPQDLQLNQSFFFSQQQLPRSPSYAKASSLDFVRSTAHTEGPRLRWALPLPSHLATIFTMPLLLHNHSCSLSRTVCPTDRSPSSFNILTQTCQRRGKA